MFKQFAVSDKFKSIVSQSNLFSSVNYIDAYYSTYNKTQFPFISMERCVAPARHHRKFGHNLDVIPSRIYTHLISGCASIYAMDLKQRFLPDGQTIFYEEGEGSYLGNFVKSAACFDREILMASKSASRRLMSDVLNVVSRGRLRFNAHELRVYKPELVEKGIYRPFVQVMPINPPGSGKNSVFEKTCARSGADCHLSWVYLDNPDADVSDEQRARLMTVLNCVVDTGHELRYRPHPRGRKDLSSTQRSWVSVDDGSDMWELICLRGEICDDTVLFGYGSTAQTNPVRMFGIKPRLVFLHRLMHEGIDRTYAQRCFENTLRLYGDDSGRIFAPASLAELEDVLVALQVSEKHAGFSAQ